MRYNLMQRADGKFVSKQSPFRFQTSQRLQNASAARASLEEVARIACPVLEIAHGEQSNVLTPEAAQRFVDVLPNGRLVTVPRCGRNVHTQNTAGFLEVFVPFIDADDRAAEKRMRRRTAQADRRGCGALSSSCEER